jgi:hypothetical protein
MDIHSPLDALMMTDFCQSIIVTATLGISFAVFG